MRSLLILSLVGAISAVSMMDSIQQDEDSDETYELCVKAVNMGKDLIKNYLNSTTVKHFLGRISRQDNGVREFLGDHVTNPKIRDLLHKDNLSDEIPSTDDICKGIQSILIHRRTG
ncbi:unnamed protein product [Calicophoron daubneyi]|uniref:Uncharacterized protein n=1 Tax=Calicophoron daubneyi TaxID=300641 RepID=A0AAV2TK21_CALDB